jgi:MFS family permease
VAGRSRMISTLISHRDSHEHRAWYVVALLLLTQITSYIDRFLPGLMLSPIKRDLGLTDFEVGLLIGPAFGIFYVLMGLPFGWLADRFSRRKLLAGAIAVWSLMTAAGSIAQSFRPLLLARLGVGLGEAAVAPCAVSLISDYFPRDRRAKAMSVYMSGTFIGAGVAFLLGGPVVAAIAAAPTSALPLLGALRPWQLTFLLVGLPGLFLALAMLTLREPARREQTTGGGPGTLSTALSYARRRWRAFGTLMLASGCVVTLGSLSFWNVALFERNWGWGVRDVGIATGLLFLTGGPLGTWLGVWLTNRWLAEGRREATLRVLWVGLTIAVPSFALYPVMPTPALALVIMFFAFVGQATAAAAGPASISLIAPGQIRAQLTAIYYVVISVSGQLLGPPPVGWMTDRLGGPLHLREAMAIEVVAIGVPVLLFVWRGLESYGAEVLAVERAIDASSAAVIDD